MLIEVMKVIGIIYLWTWFIWPFVFIYSLVHAIKNLVKEEHITTNIFIASISFLVIICGIQVVSFGL